MHRNILSDPSISFNEVAPGRVVSLVPSVTSSLFDLGLGAAVVGITDYCTHPPDQISNLPRVGGPKTLSLDDIRALQPDLVIANQEENDRAEIEALAEAGISVWLTFPTTVQAAINDLWTISNLFRSDLAMRQVDSLERAVEWARSAAESLPPVRYFCPIWQESLADAGSSWWMTFNARTYMGDLLALFGGENVFSTRERRYPLAADLGKAAPEDAMDRDTRYPRVAMDEILQAAPELILLPSEPYSYTQAHCQEFLNLFAETPAGQSARIFPIDGKLIMWPGTQLVLALNELPMLFNL